MMDPDEVVAMQQVVLEKLRLGLQQRVGAHVLESAQPEFIIDRLSGDMIARLRADVLSEKLPPESATSQADVTFESPASPFQHWKQKHAEAWWLAWFVRRWPVREDVTTRTVTMTVDLTKYRTYPQANYVLPDGFGAPVLVHTLRTSFREGVEW